VVKKCGVVIHTSFDTCMKMSAPDVNILVSNSIVADCQDYYCPNAASAHWNPVSASGRHIVTLTIFHKSLD